MPNIAFLSPDSMTKSILVLIYCVCLSGCIQGFEGHERFSMGGPIFWGAATGRVSTVKQCLDAGVNVNAVKRKGDTPLILAVKNHQIDVVRVLLFFGAKPSIKNKNGESAIDIASEKNDRDIYILLQK